MQTAEILHLKSFAAAVPIVVTQMALAARKQTTIAR
jgi:hypothetical protein